MAQNPSNPTTNLPAGEPLLDLSQAPLPGLVGYTQVYYHRADGLRPFAVAGGQVVGSLVSEPGFQWQELPLSPLTIKLTETAKDSRHGPSYQVKLQGERPQAVANVLGALDALARRPVVVLVRQVDGQLRVVGNGEEPLRLATTGQGQHPGTRAGLDVVLTGLTTQLAPFYTGALVTAGGGVAPNLSGGIRVFNGRGELQLVVPASGYDLVVEGPFRTDLRIQAR